MEGRAKFGINMASLKGVSGSDRERERCLNVDMDSSIKWEDYSWKRRREGGRVVLWLEVEWSGLVTVESALYIPMPRRPYAHPISLLFRLH